MRQRVPNGEGMDEHSISITYEHGSEHGGSGFSIEVLGRGTGQSRRFTRYSHRRCQVKNVRSIFFRTSEIDFAFADGATPKPDYEPFAVRICDNKGREAEALYQIALAVTDAKAHLKHGS